MSVNFSDYMLQYCTRCDSLQVIFKKGVTACPNCGAPIADCCLDCESCEYATCPYSSKISEEGYHKIITNPPIPSELDALIYDELSKGWEVSCCTKDENKIKLPF